MNGHMASYGMTIQGLLGKDMLSLSMPEFKDDLKNNLKDDLIQKSSFSVKNLKDLGNNQGSDPTSAYLGGYHKAHLLNKFSVNSNTISPQAPSFGTVQSAYLSNLILLGSLTFRMCSWRMTSRYIQR